MKNASRRAVLVSVLFGAFGVASFLFAPQTDILFPLCLYYIVLLINTYFSVRLFAAITPHDATQTSFDIVLVVVYFALAFSLGSVVMFSAVSALLFLCSMGKYAHLRRLISHDAFLRRKIKINSLGLVLSLVSLALAFLGSALAAAWILSGIFALANIYLLLLNPMYRLNQ